MLAGQIISPLPRRGMIELIQFPYSPFCIVARRILDYAGARYKLVNIPNDDRPWSGGSPGVDTTRCPSSRTANR